MRTIQLGTPMVNSYLFPTLAGYLLVDTGYESSAEGFFRRLKSRGMTPGDIAWIFLTHAHDDHAGFLNQLLGRTRARVLLHPLAVERLKGGKNPPIGGCPNAQSAIACRAMGLFGQGTHTFPPLPRELENRLIPLQGARRRELESVLGVRFLDTPGHTADSISLFNEDGSLFCGDAAMSGLPSRHHATIWMEDAAEYRASWRVLLDCEPRVIYPGHGRPIKPAALERDIHRLEGIVLRKPGGKKA